MKTKRRKCSVFIVMKLTDGYYPDRIAAAFARAVREADKGIGT